MKILPYLLARFSEPSSYAGLGALMALIGWNLSDPVIGQLAQLLAGGCALLAVALKERGMIGAVVLVFALVPALSGCAGVPAAVLGGLGSAGSAFMALDKLTEITCVCGYHS
jgi:serine acetyltransferase